MHVFGPGVVSQWSISSGADLIPPSTCDGIGSESKLIGTTARHKYEESNHHISVRTQPPSENRTEWVFCCRWMVEHQTRRCFLFVTFRRTKWRSTGKNHSRSAWNQKRKGFYVPLPSVSLASEENPIQKATIPAAKRAIYRTASANKGSNQTTSGRHKLNTTASTLTGTLKSSPKLINFANIRLRLGIYRGASD